MALSLGFVCQFSPVRRWSAFYYGRGAKLAVLAAFVVSGSVSVTQGALGRYFRKRVSIALFLLAIGAIGAVAAGTNLMDKLSLDRFEGASLDNPDDTAEWPDRPGGLIYMMPLWRRTRLLALALAKICLITILTLTIKTTETPPFARHTIST